MVLKGDVETFPGKVRRTADPSASLGMTKRRGLLKGEDCYQGKGWFLGKGDAVVGARNLSANCPLLLATALSF
jgi:hypothetical protein